MPPRRTAVAECSAVRELDRAGVPAVAAVGGAVQDQVGGARYPIVRDGSVDDRDQQRGVVGTFCRQLLGLAGRGSAVRAAWGPDELPAVAAICGAVDLPVLALGPCGVGADWLKPIDRDERQPPGRLRRATGGATRDLVVPAAAADLP